MRKSVTFISAALTAFVLAMLAGVVYAYNNGLSASNMFSQQTSTQPAVSLPLMAPTAAPTSAAVSPKDAAADAAQFLNRTDLYSIQLASYNGAQAYEVKFSSGDIVYVSMSGQVAGVASPTQAPPVVIYAPAKHDGGGAHPSSGDGHQGGGEGGGDD